MGGKVKRGKNRGRPRKIWNDEVVASYGKEKQLG